MKRFYKSKVGLTVAGLVGGVILLIACAGGTATGSGPVNTDPRKGWVELFPGEAGGGDARRIDKRCDGSTLLYKRLWGESGIAVIANSPECG